MLSPVLTYVAVTEKTVPPNFIETSITFADNGNEDSGRFNIKVPMNLTPGSVENGVLALMLESTWKLTWLLNLLAGMYVCFTSWLDFMGSFTRIKVLKISVRLLIPSSPIMLLLPLWISSFQYWFISIPMVRRAILLEMTFWSNPYFTAPISTDVEGRGGESTITLFPILFMMAFNSNGLSANPPTRMMCLRDLQAGIARRSFTCCAVLSNEFL